MGSSISRLVNLSNVPVDPLDKVNNYLYGVTYDKLKYQVAATLEDSSSVVFKSFPVIDEISALGNTIAIVKGNYNGYIRFSTGSNTYLSNLPSLIFNYS